MKSTLCISVLFMVACGGKHAGTSTGNGMSVGVFSSRAPLSTTPKAIDAQSFAFNIEAARASIDHIGLHLPKGWTCDDVQGTTGEGVSCESDLLDDSHEIRVEGPFVVDLLAKTVTPLLNELTLPALTYSRVDVALKPARTGDGIVGSGDRLNDRSIVASGSFDYKSLPRTFEFSLRFTEQARFENSEGVSLSESQPSDILMRLDVDRWFSTLPITSCLDSGELQLKGSHLVISDNVGQCSAIEGTLRDAIRDSGSFVKE